MFCSILVHATLQRENRVKESVQASKVPAVVGSWCGDMLRIALLYLNVAQMSIQRCLIREFMPMCSN